MTDHLEQNPSTSSTRDEADRRPGWPEIVVGLGATAVAMAALVFLIPVISSDPVVYGLTLAAWSAGVGFVGFGAAFIIRIRSLAAFGVRRTTTRWMLIGVGAGVVAFLLKGVVNWAIASLTGFDENAQVPYYDAAAGGVLAAILTFAFLSFLVPIGEELLFRGVVMRGLLRYGAVVAVVGSSVVFALFHGINTALPTAFVVGIVAAEIARRSGSIWPAVAVHIVNNLALPLFVVLFGLGSAA